MITSGFPLHGLFIGSCLPSSYVWQICFACFILEIFIKCSVHTHVTDDTSKPYLRIAGALVCSREPIWAFVDSQFLSRNEIPKGTFFKYFFFFLALLKWALDSFYLLTFFFSLYLIPEMGWVVKRGCVEWNWIAYLLLSLSLPTIWCTYVD